MRKLDGRTIAIGIVGCEMAFAFWCAAASSAVAADSVAGNLLNFNNSGAWSWYMDERAIVDTMGDADPNNDRILVGSNTSGSVVYPTGRPSGAVDVATYDVGTGLRSRFQLADIDTDDHNAPGLLVMPNGKYLAMYSNHGNTGMGDYLTRYRVSTNPHDSSAWTAEQSFDWRTVTGWNTAPNANNRVSYHNLYYLSAEDRIYNFSRGTHQSANSLLFNYNTNAATWGGQLTESATGGYSTGYIKYASNGVDRIYFLSTETHPRNYNNNVYVGYISGGMSYDMNGTLADSNIFDNDDTGGAGAVPDITSFTKIFQSDPTGPGTTPLYSNAWTVDFALDASGNPYGLFNVRWKEDDPLGNGSPYGDNEKDNNGFYHHTLFYARYDGADWHVNPVAQMGKMLYLSEEDYTGLGALNPGDPNTIYVSTPLDPRTAVDPPLTPGGASPSPSPTDFFWNPTYQVLDGKHEIYKGVTADAGQTWNWTPITQNSSVDNLRPIVPTWDNDHSALIWFRGTYTTAHNIDAAVVGVIEQNDTQTGLVHYVDASAANTTLANGSPISGWTFNASAGNEGSVLAATAGVSALKTELTGLADGDYDVFAYFWADQSNDWRIQAGLAAGSLQLYRDNGAQQAESSQFDGSVALSGGGGFLYRAYLGRSQVSGGSTITAFIDDFATGSTTRAWYDGLGYALVTDVVQGLAGDFNGDLVVNAADYTVWRDSLGAADDSTIHDNGDDVPGVDLADYDVWKDHFGNTSNGDGGGASVSVPEPSTSFLCLSATALVFFRCKKRIMNPLRLRRVRSVA